jgi:metal-responsive CopG/Arc/MetJ family transcriptional regulator
MSTQLTVRLPEDLRRALEAASRKMQRQSSDIVRIALRQFLQVPEQDGSLPAQRVRGLIGSLESGLPDLARRHREYILESLRNAR